MHKVDWRGASCPSLPTDCVVTAADTSPVAHCSVGSRAQTLNFYGQDYTAGEPLSERAGRCKAFEQPVSSRKSNPPRPRASAFNARVSKHAPSCRSIGRRMVVPLRVPGPEWCELLSVRSASPRYSWGFSHTASLTVRRSSRPAGFPVTSQIPRPLPRLLELRAQACVSRQRPAPTTDEGTEGTLIATKSTTVSRSVLLAHQALN